MPNMMPSDPIDLSKVDTSFADYTPIDPALTLSYEQETQPIVWDGSIPLYSTQNMEPLAGLSLAQLSEGVDQSFDAYLGPSHDLPTMQGLYYDTVPHSLDTAWSQHS